MFNTRAISKLDQLSSWRKVLLLCFLVPFARPSIGLAQSIMSGKITGFHLERCGETKCIILQSAQAFSGVISSGYAMPMTLVTFTDRKTSQQKSFKAREVFYDEHFNKIFIRDIDLKNKTDAIYDLDAEDIKLYKRMSMAGT